MTSIVTRLAAFGTWFVGGLLLLPGCGGGLSDSDKTLISELKQEIAKNHSELADLRKEVADSGKAVGTQFEDKNGKLLTALGTFSDGIYSRIDATKAAVESAGGADQAVASLQKTIEDLGGRIASLEQALATHASATGEKLAAHGTMGEAVQAKLQGLEGAHQAMTTSMKTGFEQTGQAFQAEAKRFETALQDMGKRLDGLGSTIAGITTTQGQIQKDVATREQNLKAAIEQSHATSNQAVQAAQKAAKDAIDALDAKVMAKLNEIAEAVKTGEDTLVTRLDSQSQEIGKSASGIEGLFANVERNLQGQFDTLRQGVENLSSHSRDVSTVVEEAIVPVKDGLANLEKRIATVDGLTKAQTDLGVALASVKAQLGELKTLETADSKARDQAHGKIDLTATKLAQLEQRHADAVKERAAIAKELGAIRTLLTTPAEKPSGEAQPAEAAAASTDK